MAITNNEFEVLICIERNKSKMSQRELANITRLSLGTISNAIKSLLENGLIDENGITKEGLKELEPYRVKRAIFLAAGVGSRLIPITLNTPKPLVLVHGKRLIDTLLDAVKEAGIEEIIIVTGYLNEQFEVLKHKYPNIKFIYNKDYNTANNIMSAYYIRDYLDNAYVLESDFLLNNNYVIRKYEYQSNYLGKYMDVTDDWCLKTKNGYIIKETVGGYKCYQMVGMAYLNKEDGKKVKKDIEKVINTPGGKERYWEQTFLDVYKKNYKIRIRECGIDDIIEIDTFDELKKIDKVYDVKQK